MGNVLLVKEREIEAMREENTKLHRRVTILENMLKKVPENILSEIS